MVVDATNLSPFTVHILIELLLTFRLIVSVLLQAYKPNKLMTWDAS